MVTRRQTSARNVCSAIARHTEKTQEAFAGVLGPFLKEGDSVPDLIPLQHMLEQVLEQLRRDLVASDETHLLELQEHRAARARRDTASAALAERLVQLRKAMTGVFGDLAADGYKGIGGAMIRNPEILARKARRVLERLQSGTPEMPPPRVPGFTVDPQPWAGLLEGPLRELEEALKEVADDRRDSEGTLVAKHEALEAYDRAFQKVAQLQESLFRFADLKGLAERVRPSSRRPGETRTLAQSETESEVETEAAQTPSESSGTSEPAEETTPVVRLDTV